MAENNITVLIIDDDQDTVEIFEEWLKMEKIQVLGKGYDGKQAVELYKKLHPNTILLDIMMPEYDGLYAIKKIREIDHDAKFLILTADISEKTKLELDKLKPSGILYKPFDMDDVTSMLKKINAGEIHVLVDRTKSNN